MIPPLTLLAIASRSADLYPAAMISSMKAPRFWGAHVPFAWAAVDLVDRADLGVGVLVGFDFLLGGVIGSAGEGGGEGVADSERFIWS